MDRVELLCDIGLSQADAVEVEEDISEHGCILEQMQTHPKVVALLASLHTNSWLKFGDSDTRLVVNRGGKTGVCIRRSHF